MDKVQCECCVKKVTIGDKLVELLPTLGYLKTQVSYCQC